MIGRAAGDRAVEISGPTTLAEVAATAARLHAHGARLVLVDGAINRLGSASPRVSDARHHGDRRPRRRHARRDRRDHAGHARDADPPRSRPADPRARDRRGRFRGARAVAVDERGRAAALDLATVVGEGVTGSARSRAPGRPRVSSSAARSPRSSPTTSCARCRRGASVTRRRARRHGAHPARQPPCPASGAAASTCACSPPLRVLAVTTNPYRVPAALQPQDLLRRGRRRSRRSRPRLRRRPRPGRGAGRRPLGTLGDDLLRCQGRCDSARRDQVRRDARHARSRGGRRHRRRHPAPYRRAHHRLDRARHAAPAGRRRRERHRRAARQRGHRAGARAAAERHRAALRRSHAAQTGKNAQEVAEGVAAGALALDDGARRAARRRGAPRRRARRTRAWRASTPCVAAARSSSPRSASRSSPTST